MKENYLIENDTAQEIFSKINDLPIIDYHCHLSPQEIFEDKPFDNIGEIFLAHDHYKWRLMRGAGIKEKYITGDSTWKEKFLAFASAIEFAAGNPLYHWTAMELSIYFGIETPLTTETAEDIWNMANKVIKDTSMSPRKLISQSNVEYIATTDDIADTLEWHKKINNDKSFSTKVVPSFRTDKLLLIKNKDYNKYIENLASVSNTPIKSIDDVKKAIVKRLDFFTTNGCKFSDIGIPFFPNSVADENSANDTFKKAISNKQITNEEYSAFLGNMYLFLGAEYKKRNIVMQLHLAVVRNVNETLFSQCGADCGVDCVGDALSGEKIGFMLNELNKVNSLPKTIIYTLNPAINAQLVSIAGAFPGVICGAAWWFCDHKRGIKEMMNVIAEIGYIGEFLGMLTDSRSFLSYGRHNYFRRILSNTIAEWVEKENYPKESGIKLAKKIAYTNINNLIGE